jgi:hypothetical protein
MKVTVNFLVAVNTQMKKKREVKAVSQAVEVEVANLQLLAINKKPLLLTIDKVVSHLLDQLTRKQPIDLFNNCDFKTNINNINFNI